MINRDKILAKVRGLLSKTVENGCTEAEALAALQMARAMMDAYEVTEEDLNLTKAEAKAIFGHESIANDPHGCKLNVAGAVAEFCDCKFYRDRSGESIVFVGLPSDVEFARYMTGMLASFVLGELSQYLASLLIKKGQRRRIINGFALGATSRISQRLMALVVEAKATQASNSRALVVVKGALIDDAMKAAGINLGRARKSRRVAAEGAYRAGQAAGDRASFGRPIGSSYTNLLG